MAAMTELVDLKPWQAPRAEWETPAGARWSGFLTTENVTHVAHRIRAQFEGRALVVVSAHEYRRWEPEVQVPVRIERGVQTDRAADHAYVMFPCGGFVYGLHSYMHEQPRFRLDEPEGSDRPALVLEWIDEAYERYWTPFLEFDERSLTVRERAPNGLAYWLRFDLLEHPGALNVVLEPEEAALAREGIDVALGEGLLAKEGYDVMHHIDAVFGGEDKVSKWLPR